MSATPILMYHSVNADVRGPHGKLAFTPRQFRAHLSAYRSLGLRCVSLGDFWRECRSGGRAPSDLLVLTFDDGYVDNLHVVLPMLKECGFRATVFVNSAHTPDGGVEPELSWGTLSTSELRALEASGVFEVESHCASHNRKFRSGRVIDLYDPSKFGDYYWLLWELWPETRLQWRGDLSRFARRVPAGYPILESDRGLVTRSFRPERDAVESCVAKFQRDPVEARASLIGTCLNGDYESIEDFDARRRFEIQGSRAALEKWIGRRIRFLCFPGGAYDDECISLATEAGYLAYMLSSRDQGSNDAEVVEQVRRFDQGGKCIGLKRISISNDVPRVGRTRLGSWMNARLKIGVHRGDPGARALMRVARSLRRGR